MNKVIVMSICYLFVWKSFENKVIFMSVTCLNRGGGKGVFEVEGGVVFITSLGCFGTPDNCQCGCIPT